MENLALETDYKYDTLNNLIKVTQRGTSNEIARIRSYSYDSLSRVVTSQNVETGTICYGVWNKGTCREGYDANGNVTVKTDNRGVVTNYTYDALNRLQSKTYQNDLASTPSSCYQYDTATNGVGRLGTAWTQAGSCGSELPATGYVTYTKEVSYDAMGRLIQEQQCVPGKCSPQTNTPFTMNYAYDLAGSMIQLDDGLGQVNWAPSYNSAGRLLGVKSTTVAGIPNPAQLFSNPVYNAAGQLTSWGVGSIDSSTPALTGTRTYDSRLRVSTEKVVGHD